jgi:GT2 family glycosyltransferase
VKVSYGDTSSGRCLSEESVRKIEKRFSTTFDFEYEFFGKNLGSARGHNTLAAKADADYLLILNPDVIVSPRVLENMLYAFGDPATGMVEGKQLPIEHPKDYDPKTGETGWATTAVALTPLALFRDLDGFDAESFFLYCDDVDYSWRVREGGYKVIFAPHAVVFHDKRISPEGAWQPGNAERLYSAEAALMMAHKWSRPDLVEKISIYFRDGNEFERAALEKYEKMKTEGTLPTPRDPDHRIGEFVGHLYATHRYAL